MRVKKEMQILLARNSYVEKGFLCVVRGQPRHQAVIAGVCGATYSAMVTLTHLQDAVQRRVG